MIAMTSETGDDDLQLSAESEKLKLPVHDYLRAAEEKYREKRREDTPPPASLPMIVGVFEFPWYLQSLGAWLPMSLMMLVAGGMMAYFVTYGLQMGGVGVRTVGVSACMATVFAFAYASACCLKVIEQTGGGRNVIDDWPNALDWKEWAWGLVFMVVMLLESALIAFVPTVGFTPWTWIPFLVLTDLLFPFVLLSSLEADVLAPVSRTVFQSLAKNTLAWLVFYGGYIGVWFAWVLITVVAAFLFKWGALLISMPLFAAMLLIQARLLGRLAWCIGRKSNS
jgi:hypothetical protein